MQTIAQLSNGIILDNYDKKPRSNESYQSETQMEENLIKDLISLGYEKIEIKDTKELYLNLRIQIQNLNNTTFTDSEWERFLSEYLDTPTDTLIEKTRKIQDNHIYDFKDDNNNLKNIKIIDKKNIYNNHLQVVNQITQKGSHENRYDVSILVNGLPLVHIELKKRGVNLKEAFNQIHRYSKESFNIDHSLYKYVQIFVISNGTLTKYFANTTAQNKNHYEFTCEWADAKNQVINDIEDFTATFFAKRTILELLSKYCVFDVNNTLLIMRPYQIAATERILQKINSSFQNKKAGSSAAGGFIWHTTGSGKTLTSFKTARLATDLEYIDKVFFVVDRKDLDNQTIQEYEKFQKGCVSSNKNTKELKSVIEKNDNKIIVTTIQKLNEFVKKNTEHEIYKKQCVLIYDECHRSQFGEAQKNIRKSFKNYYQFGFTGTPIFPQNALGGETTEGIFGKRLHSYVITDAIRDKKVLKFKVDYNNINVKFKDAEIQRDEKELQKLEKSMLLHPERISQIASHILKVYNTKTHRNEHYDLKNKRLQGFNAMFAVQSIEAAKIYYEEFQKLQKDLPEDKRLKIATIFSFAANEEQKSIGEIIDESFETTALNSSAKEFLDKAIKEYNSHFSTNFSTSEFQEYYKHLSQKVKNKEVDLIIVVGMFLTGFDAPTLNTLFVDKNLKFHGLIQAFSRTNRILNSVKTFGNIVCFRDLQEDTKDAIKMFGDENSANIILEKSYSEHINGYIDEDGKKIQGYIEISNELLQKFPDPTQITLQSEKKEFLTLFGEFLKSQNILKNFDEFENFKEIIPLGLIQDMQSVYLDIKEEIFNKKQSSQTKNETLIDFSDVEFQIELLQTQEINLDYILSLIITKAKEFQNIDTLKDEVKRTIRSSLGNRAREELILEFINKNEKEIYKTQKTQDILKAFYSYAQKQKEEQTLKLTQDENLKQDALRFIQKSIKDGYVNRSGTDFDKILPPTSRRSGEREAKKQSVFTKIQKLVEVFTGI